VEISPSMGELRTRSKIMVNQTKAVDKIRLIKKLGHVSEELMDKVNQASKLHYILNSILAINRILKV
jgi:mRNA-degrading endonuclease toxin of MazEF toxin-antitoxin module